MMAPDAHLEGWVRDLRAHVEHGDLAGLGPIELGYGTGRLPSETAIRVMLDDLRDLDDPRGSWGGDPAWRDVRRRALMDDFRRLRELFG